MNYIFQSIHNFIFLVDNTEKLVDVNVISRNMFKEIIAQLCKGIRNFTRVVHKNMGGNINVNQ
jgi:hypothetical protein